MRIIEPSIELMRTGLETNFMTPEQFIERVGRTCYKSEDKITDDSSAKFVSGLIKRGHEAMIEHWNLVFKTDVDTYQNMISDCDTLQHCIEADLGIEFNAYRSFLRFTDCMLSDGEMRFVTSGNMRAWRGHAKACVENYGELPSYMWGIVRCYPLFFPEYQNYIPPIIVNDILIPISIEELELPERLVHQDITMKFVCDRGVSHEIVRHRVASFAQESTRYCNYGADKFGNEITVIRPSWCCEGDDVYDFWKVGCYNAEGAYFTCLANGAVPQGARAVLPNSLKTEIIVTMNVAGWNHFFKLRCAPDAQPDMRECAQMAAELFKLEGGFE
jgi:thymidylate synthase (FAD)